MDKLFLENRLKVTTRKARLLSCPEKLICEGLRVIEVVICAIDRTGNIITELICKARIKHTDLERLFKDRIEDESILCTDSHKRHIKFAQN
ncbi:hypothetical protein K2F41_14285 [Clostridium sp. CM027]|uniref:hypothetical protein n=1 Tax=Clostridium sp. CM027 TaxID=2849865 RepID=UPI001C6E29B1|nr:hypothetical protein [Clostridium sp. CM027]MBW9146710.1 hypothetical protein [Clostridium sp. CM027]